MLINFPDMGFSSSQNINVPDKFYLDIKESVVQCISKRQKDQQIQFQKDIQDHHKQLKKQISEMSLSQKTQSLLINQNWNLPQTLVKMQGSTNLSHATLENIMKLTKSNENNLAKSMSSISDYGKQRQDSRSFKRQQSFSKMAARDLYLEMRTQLVNQTEEFMNSHCTESPVSHTKAMTQE